ncbi:MAG: CapA family protein, partial [Butyrivibrio sp.]|nr:CapA family protein [Butyrivibrio sp.]
MRRRGRGLIAALIGTLIILGAVVFAALWWNGFFLPSWIKWNERTEASDGADTGEVASIVLKERNLIAYNRGEEVYRTPGSWRVQDVIWQDINFDGEREIVVLYWSHDKEGAESAPLTGTGSIGLKQHIAVYDGVTRGMNMIWQSAPLATRAASIRMNEAGYLVIFEPESRQTAWVWTGDAVVASNAASPMQSTITVQTENAAGMTSDPQGAETGTQPGAATETQQTGGGTNPGTGATGDGVSAPSGSSVSFLAVGDDLVHENVWRTGVSNGGDYSYLFENIIPMINSVDFACYNQETMFVEESAGYSGYPMFGSPIGIGEAAIRAGFDIVTCSTNHSLDKGTYGIETTADFFESHKAEITYLGIYTRDKWNEPEHEIKTVSKNGITFALLNFTYGLNGIPLPADAPYCVDTNLHDLSNY